MTAPLVLLIDNGSLRPEATFSLRHLARELSARTKLDVEAVSLLHSHKIPADDLEGLPATIVRRRLRECVQQGLRHVICLPLFLGPSLAVREYLPQLIEEAQAECPELRVDLAEVLAGPDCEVPDPRLAQMLADVVRRVGVSPSTKVALVDHGTPYEPVNRVRNAVVGQLALDLGVEVAKVLACSMERREGDAYAFNEPLLENLTEVSGFSGGRLVLAMFFLLPGRHAGDGGDVAEICERLKAARAFDQIEMTPLLGTHPGLVDLLEDRLNEVLAL